MTSEMNLLLDRLQEAIDEAISGSDRISAIVAEMQRAGYDLCLVVESSATISPIEGTSPMEEDTQSPDCIAEPRHASASNCEIEMTGDDLAFLREMNIAA
jgi:hypothetical protein